MVSLEEAKKYLVVEFDDDDEMIQSMINSSESVVKDLLRVEELPEDDSVRVAVLYAAAYLYEHREEADMNALVLNLRYYLSGKREVLF